MRGLLLLLVVLLLGVASYIGLKPDAESVGLKPGERLRIGATIYPLADWLREIAGPDADVHLFCSGVSNPHHFDPSPQDATEVSRAHAIFSIGLGLDEWAHKLVKNSGRRNLPLHETGFWISARKLLKSEEIVPSVKPGAPVFAKKSDPHGHDDHSGHSHEHHHHGDEDPHYWLDPERAALVVKRMADELAQLDAAHAAAYQQRAAAYIAKLDELKKQIDAEKRAQPQKLVTLHDAYGYLFDRMNIQIAAVVQVSPGVEPATRDFSEAVRVMKEIGQKTVFTEPAGNPLVAKMLATDVNGATALLDPMDIETSDAGKSYLDRMAHNLRTLSATRPVQTTDTTQPAGKSAP